ncbi:MAG: acyl carrier protein [Nitrospira sp.]|nr:acyl carrier protein [Nitrospira sp.]
MENWQVMVVVLLVILGGVGFEWHTRRFKRIVRSTLSSRPQLTAEQFGRIHFGESILRTTIAGDLRNIVAKHLPVSIDGLHPDDKFQKTLMIDIFDSLATVEIVMEIEDRFGIKIGDDRDIKPDITSRQLVDYIECQANRK